MSKTLSPEAQRIKDFEARQKIEYYEWAHQQEDWPAYCAYRESGGRFHSFGEWREYGSPESAATENKSRTPWR